MLTNVDGFGVAALHSGEGGSCGVALGAVEGVAGAAQRAERRGQAVDFVQGHPKARIVVGKGGVMIALRAESPGRARVAAL